MKLRHLPLIIAAALALATSACGKDGAPAAAEATSCGKPPDLTVASDVTVPGSSAFKKMKERGHVVVGVKADQPGLAYKAVNGDRCGFDIDIARLISAGLGFDPASIEYKEIPSANRESAIRAGQIDYYVGSYSITDKRKKLIGFAGPYLITGQGLMVRKDETDITDKSTLMGKKVCGGTGTTSTQLVKDEGLTQPENIIEFKTGAECVSQMLDGEADALITDEAILIGYVAGSPDDLKIVGEPFTTEKYGIGLAHSDKALRDTMNDILTTAADDGTWKRLYDANLGKSGVPATPPAVEKY
jgi:glutamate transport system substrate-binding protein